MSNRGKKRARNELGFFWGMILIILCLTFAITALAEEPAEDTEEAVTEEEIEPIVVTIAAEEIIEVDVIETETEPEVVAQKESVSVGSVGLVSTISMSDSDYDLLCKIVEAEATGQAVEDKMYVAAAIMNRVNSDSFPNTVSGVVYESGQFSPVSDGRINCRPTETTVEAVDRVLAGETDAQGATYFMNPKGSSKKNVNWFRSHLTYLFSYGGHEFYK